MMTTPRTDTTPQEDAWQPIPRFAGRCHLCGEASETRVCTPCIEAWAPEGPWTITYAGHLTSPLGDCHGECPVCAQEWLERQSPHS